MARAQPSRRRAPCSVESRETGTFKKGDCTFNKGVWPIDRAATRASRQALAEGGETSPPAISLHVSKNDAAIPVQKQNPRTV
jgi:hypothetical protein